MLNKKKIEPSYRIHLTFNLSDTHISWKGYLIGSLTPTINIHLMTYQKKTDILKMSTVKNPTLTFDLTQISSFFPMQSIVYLKPQ